MQAARLWVQMLSFPRNVYVIVLARMSKDAVRCLGLVRPGNRAPKLALYHALLLSRVDYKSPCVTGGVP